MLNKSHYLLFLLLLIASSGCQTLNGAATGFGQDVQNISNPDKNGWHALQKADAWTQQNMW
jgi:predicted small secreted protein